VKSPVRGALADERRARRREPLLHGAARPERHRVEAAGVRLGALCSLAVAARVDDLRVRGAHVRDVDAETLPAAGRRFVKNTSAVATSFIRARALGLRRVEGDTALAAEQDSVMSSAPPDRPRG
jgi:hypothetical protein